MRRLNKKKVNVGIRENQTSFKVEIHYCIKIETESMHVTPGKISIFRFVIHQIIGKISIFRFMIQQTNLQVQSRVL